MLSLPQPSAGDRGVSSSDLIWSGTASCWPSSNAAISVHAPAHVRARDPTSVLKGFVMPVMVAAMPVSAINNSVINEIALRMGELATTDVGVGELRERHHLEPVARSVLEERFSGSPLHLGVR